MISSRFALVSAALLHFSSFWPVPWPPSVIPQSALAAPSWRRPSSAATPQLPDGTRQSYHAAVKFAVYDTAIPADSIAAVATASETQSEIDWRAPAYYHETILARRHTRKFTFVWKEAFRRGHCRLPAASHQHSTLRLRLPDRRRCRHLLPLPVARNSHRQRRQGLPSRHPAANAHDSRLYRHDRYRRGHARCRRDGSGRHGRGGLRHVEERALSPTVCRRRRRPLDAARHHPHGRCAPAGQGAEAFAIHGTQPGGPPRYLLRRVGAAGRRGPRNPDRRCPRRRPVRQRPLGRTAGDSRGGGRTARLDAPRFQRAPAFRPGFGRAAQRLDQPGRDHVQRFLPFQPGGRCLRRCRTALARAAERHPRRQARLCVWQFEVAISRRWCAEAFRAASALDRCGVPRRNDYQTQHRAAHQRPDHRGVAVRT